MLDAVINVVAVLKSTKSHKFYKKNLTISLLRAYMLKCILGSSDKIWGDQDGQKIF